jgi:phosphatidylglycerol lysyltransferase
MGDRLCHKLEAFAYDFGRSYDSYLVIEQSYEYLWNADESGVVAFNRCGQTLFVVGGLLAAEAHKEQLLAGLVAYASINKLTVAVFNLGEAELPSFRRQGWQLNKFGEDAIVSLRMNSWQGKDYAWVRRQENYLQRQGMGLSEVRRETMTSDEWQALMTELMAMNAVCLGMRPQRPQKLTFEGWFDPDQLGRKRIFIARDAQGLGSLEGFLLCNPYQGGREWAIEIYRSRPKGRRGVVPFMMLQALRQFQAEGIRQVSLCLVPAINVEKPLPNDSWLVRSLLVTWCRFGGFLFNVRGLYHFKGRFRPNFEPRYVGIYPKATWRVVIDFLGVSGLFNLAWRWPWLKKSADHTDSWKSG